MDSEKKSHYEKKYSNFKGLPHYDLEYRKFFYRFRHLLADNGLNGKTDVRLLDLGCAFGIKTYMMAPLFAETKGVDFIANSVAVANLLNDQPTLSFEAGDVLENKSADGGYNFITALGFSPFNKACIQDVLDAVEKVAAGYATPAHVMVLGFQTDYSGKAPSGWHYHTRPELDELVNGFRQKGYSAKLYFPYKKKNNYTGRGVQHLLAELYRLLFVPVREYFVILEKK